MSNPPPIGRYTVTVVPDGTLIRHHNDPDTVSAWLQQVIARPHADHAIRSRSAPPQHDIEPVVAQLTQLRLDAGYSQQAVSDAMFCGRARLGDYERGQHRPRSDVLTAWGYVLGHNITAVPRNGARP